MRRDQPRINLCRAGLLFITGLVITSCSEKAASKRENESNTPEASREMKRESEVKTAQERDDEQPDNDQIAEDCAALVRSTKVGPARAATAECPGCPAAGAPVLAFRGTQTDTVSCSGDTCTVAVTIRAVYNPGRGEKVSGGLTAWISPEQRTAYLSGHIPPGEQTYRVQITYKHRGEGWRAVEFDRVPAG